jgi:hypothetical protein
VEYSECRSVFDGQAYLIRPLDRDWSIFARPFVCHPDQVSEAQAEAKARRDRREAICL